MGQRRCYLVCATPRSGSTLLCELLKETGVAGRPEEYFEARPKTGLPPHPGDYLENLPRTGVGIRDDPLPPRAPSYSSLVGLESYREHISRTFALGTTPNGVFGSKLMWRNLSDLQSFARVLPEYAELAPFELIERIFEAPRYVWVTRRDKVRQAVSLWRALQSRAWRLETAGDGARGLQYRYSGINHLVHSLEADDAGWANFFETHGVDVLRISYEDDLEVDRDATVRAVLRHLGVSAPRGWYAREVLRRQADALSEEWVAAYHRDAAERAAAFESVVQALR